MILSNQFAYVGVSKTGSTFVSTVLEELGGLRPDLEIRLVPGLRHAPARKVPESHRHLPLVLNIRNPFERYLSRYHFPYWREHPGSMYVLERVREHFPRFPEVDFSEFLRINFDWQYRKGPAGEARRKLRDLLSTNDIGRYSFNLMKMCGCGTTRDFANFERRGIGYFEKKLSRITFLRTENLSEDTAAWLESLGMDADFIESVRSRGRILPRRGGRDGKSDWTVRYATEEIREMLAREHLLFTLFPQYAAEAHEVLASRGEDVGSASPRPIGQPHPRDGS